VNPRRQSEKLHSHCHRQLSSKQFAAFGILEIQFELETGTKQYSDWRMVEASLPKSVLADGWKRLTGLNWPARSITQKSSMTSYCP